MGACDYIMPDLLRIGGVTGWMRLARVAEARAVPFSSHLSPDYSAHVLAATPTKHWLEFMDWAPGPACGDPLLPVEAASRRRATRPGTGVEWNETGDRALPDLDGRRTRVGGPVAPRPRRIVTTLSRLRSIAAPSGHSGLGHRPIGARAAAQVWRAEAGTLRRRAATRS